MTDYARSRDWGIYGIGIGVPSVVDKGVVLFANNLPELDNQQLDLALAEFNLPVFIDNDANLMGLGEVIYLRSVRLPRGTRFRKCVDRLISAIIGEERTGDTFPYRWKIYSRAL